ncbi:MAG: hydrogenase maturation nickel metallochaperone HypA [Actinomycetes bacterium]|jgi:hydrogenase nickel incorporation protein HypA/HybF|nr:hydrogenase maturation nickel metallochaperone HypA [Actinomycetes bacterium]
MHEMSIMQSVFDAAFKALNQSGETRITEIKLTIGEMTEIQDVSLRFAFEALKPNTPARNATLSITMLQPRSCCHDCDAEYTHDRFTMLCPHCGSMNVELLQGRELQIDALEADNEPFVDVDPDVDPFAQFLYQGGADAEPEPERVGD